MYALSELGRLSLGLLVGGLAGVLLALLYLRACAWADWDLMSSRVRRRVPDPGEPARLGTERAAIGRIRTRPDARDPVLGQIGAFRRAFAIGAARAPRHP